MSSERKKVQHRSEESINVLYHMLRLKRCSLPILIGFLFSGIDAAIGHSNDALFSDYDCTPVCCFS